MPRNARIRLAGIATADTNPTATAYRTRRFSSARRSMLSIAVSSALIAAPSRSSIRAAVAALLARPIDSYSALWKLSARSDGTSSPKSADASTL